MKVRNVIIAALGFAMAAASVGASAQTTWDRQHPARAEVNGRLASQNRRIGEERRGGEIGAVRARRLHQEDRRIRREERRLARHHHGRITLREQRRLNRQENAVSRQIGR